MRLERLRSYGSKQNGIQVKGFACRSRYRQMAEMGRVETPSKERHTAATCSRRDLWLSGLWLFDPGSIDH